MNTLNKHITGLSVLILAASFAFNIQARDIEVKITPRLGYTTVSHDGELIKIQRIQDTEHKLEGGFAKTSRPCPPFCINPIALHEDIRTIGELELIEFMEGPYYHGRGVIIDARTPSWHKRGTIPGSVNIPFTLFEKHAGDIELTEVLQSLGAKQRGEVGSMIRVVESLGLLGGDLKTDKWDFSDAKDVVLWCNGPWCGQSPRAIRGLLNIGYPAEKIHYYRGGMQTWQLLGLTTVKPRLNTVAANP